MRKTVIVDASGRQGNWELQDRCSYCRRRAVDLGNGLRLLCKRHKNRKVDLNFVRLPFVIVPEEKP